MTRPQPDIPDPKTKKMLCYVRDIRGNVPS